MSNPFAALPHLDARGQARMVDVGGKPATHRTAVAEAFIRMSPQTLDLLEAGALAKGDALSVARIAGITGSKKTADLIPLAHPIALTHAAVEIAIEDDGVRIETRVETIAPTGVEMEALTAAMTTALAIYDMAKKHDRAMVIERVQLMMKSGGQSGTYSRNDDGDDEPAPPPSDMESAREPTEGRGRSAPGSAVPNSASEGDTGRVEVVSAKRKTEEFNARRP